MSFKTVTGLCIFVTKCDLFVAVGLVLVFYTTRRVKGPGIRVKLQKTDFELWGKFQSGNFDQGKVNSVPVSGEFELSEF